MLNIVVGVIAVLIGLMGIMRNWYMFVDMLGIIIPLALLAFGVIALLAGIRGSSKRKKQDEDKE